MLALMCNLMTTSDLAKPHFEDSRRPGALSSDDLATIAALAFR